MKYYISSLKYVLFFLALTSVQAFAGEHRGRFEDTCELLEKHYKPRSTGEGLALGTFGFGIGVIETPESFITVWSCKRYSIQTENKKEFYLYELGKYQVIIESNWLGVSVLKIINKIN